MTHALSRRTALVMAAGTLASGTQAADGASVYRGYVKAWTGQVHYRAAGEKGVGKRPLICLHPSLGSSLNYEAWLAEMGRDRFAVAPDTPGYGMSDLPAAPPDIADYARAIGDLADQLGLKDFDLMGDHTGSLVCIELARQRPAQVKHLVLVTASVLTPEDIVNLRERNPIELPTDDGAFMGRTWQRFAARRDPRTSLEDWMARFRDHIAGGSKRIWGQSAAFAYPIAQTIGEVTAPILILNPGGDLNESTLRAARLVKNGKLIDRPKWPREFMTYDTAEAAALVRPFLDEDKFPEK